MTEQEHHNWYRKIIAIGSSNMAK